MCIRDRYDTMQVVFEEVISSATYTSSQLDFSFFANDDSSMHEWDFGDGNKSTEQNPMHTYLNPGMYTVQHIISNPCKSDTSYLEVNASLVHTNNVSAESIRIYPNPTSNEIYFSGFSGKNRNARIYDTQGKLVLERILEYDERKLSLSHLSKGVYIIQQKIKDKIVVSKRIIKH